MNDVDRIMQLAPVIPVLVIEDIAYARPIAEALVAGGLRALEVTLRTPVALDAIREMAKVKGAIVGAGTVLNEARSGSEPGSRRALHRLARPHRTAGQGSDRIRNSLLAGHRYGWRHHAWAGFGPEPISNFFRPWPRAASPRSRRSPRLSVDARFCPTGGITQATAPDWLALDAVLCVGGSWLVPPGRPNLEQITTSARSVVGQQ